MADLDSKACFTCHWKIENFSIWMSEMNSKVTSPLFRTNDTHHNEEWQIQLRNNDLTKSLVIRITKWKTVRSRIRKRKNPPPNCELLVIKDDGSSLGNFEMEIHQSRQGTYIDFCIPQTEIFFIKRDACLPNDTLTLCCKIDMFKYRNCHIRTVLSHQKFCWDVDFSSESPLITKILELDLASHNVQILCVNGYSVNESVRIETRAKSDVKVKFVHSKITRMNTNEAVVSSVSDDNFIFLPSLAKKYSEHFINDTLSLHCELIVELSEISYEGLNTGFNKTTNQTIESKTVAKSQLCSSSEEIYYEASNAVFNSTTLESKIAAKTPLYSSKATLNQPSNQSMNYESKNKPCLTNTLQDGLLRLYREGKFCDAVLKTDDATFLVHKAVLSARSPVFYAMFDSDTLEGQTGVVNTPDLEPDTVKNMLLFLYKDFMEDLHWEAAAKLYYAADKYDIQPLKEACLSILVAGLSVSNACHALVLAEIHQVKELWNSAQDFIGDHVEVMNSVEWQDLEENDAKLTVKVLRNLYLLKWKN